ncbi:MAG: hypothetical protein ACOYJE_05010 [Bacteroidaceae bacterium]|jgi:predicted outer membrane repeat protein
MIKEATHRLFLLCAFLLAAASAGAQTGTRIYVDLEGTATNDGTSWKTATDLATALGQAQAGAEIWVKGYEATDKVYVVPEGGYTLPAGVALYGGFAGDETSINQREVVDGIAYRMRYRTVLTGDRTTPDEVDPTTLIFPENGTRSDNATHVLMLDLSTGSGSLNSGAASIVNGITIARGHAVGSGDAGYGGGIYVTPGTNQQVGYRIEQCFFIENYATQGGGLYVADNVSNVNGSTCLVDRCGFFNNAAGDRAVLANKGGAIYLGGAGCVVNTAVFNNENGGILTNNTNNPGVRVLNSTVARNTASGIDGSGAQVVNTVIWGNAALHTDETASPDFRYCAYPEVVVTDETAGTDNENNVRLSDKNNDADGPRFNSPSLRTGFDRDFNITTTLYPLWTWVPLEGSPLVDAGNDDAFSTSAYGSTDFGGQLPQGGHGRRHRRLRVSAR